MTALIDAAIRAALLFVPLHEMPAALGPFVDHIARAHEKTRPKQIERFRRKLRPPARSARPQLSLRIAGEAWRVTKLVNEAIRAALLFVPLHALRTRLAAYVDHLERPRERSRPKQIERFQQDLQVART